MPRVFVATPAAGLVALVSLGSISATSAPITQNSGDRPEARRATTALNILESQGFCADLQSRSVSAFDQFTPEGDDYEAQISQGDHRFAVRVNPETGRVTRLR